MVSSSTVVMTMKLTAKWNWDRLSLEMYTIWTACNPNICNYGMQFGFDKMCFIKNEKRKPSSLWIYWFMRWCVDRGWWEVYKYLGILQKVDICHKKMKEWSTGMKQSWIRLINKHRNTWTCIELYPHASVNRL